MSDRLTKEEFVEKARKVHGDKYDYSKFVYVNNHTKGIIICKKHGEFLQQAQYHIRGRGCQKCLGKNLSNKEISEKFNIIHKYKYDYSKFMYVSSKSKGIIICRKHGEFLQNPYYHIRGIGCAKCYFSKLRSTKEQFIENAKKVHGEKYDYSKFEYINSRTKGIIICKRHGDFLQNPHSHLRKEGCKKCYVQKMTSNKEEFIAKALNVHGTKYDYSKFKYINCVTEGIIICKKHGDFLQKPAYHIQGNGCSKCSESRGEHNIRLFIETNKLKYKYQKTFNGCINPKTGCKVMFDFFVNKYNLVIEYDGVGHFIPTRFNGASIESATISYNSTKKTDKIKNKYCRDNNIPLLRIKYTNFKNIEEILKKEIYNISNNLPSKRIRNY